LPYGVSLHSSVLVAEALSNFLFLNGYISLIADGLDREVDIISELDQIAPL